jgi:hypothetical protein
MRNTIEPAHYRIDVMWALNYVRESLLQGRPRRKVFSNFKYYRENRRFTSLEDRFVPLQPNKLAKYGRKRDKKSLLFIPIFKTST